MFLGVYIITLGPGLLIVLVYISVPLTYSVLGMVEVTEGPREGPGLRMLTSWRESLLSPDVACSHNTSLCSLNVTLGGDGGWGQGGHRS